MKYWWTLALFFSLAVGSYAREISVADYGIVPGKDVTLALNDLIQSLWGEVEVTLVFPKGEYEFYPENAMEVHRVVSNHDNSLKRMAFPLFKCQDWTIDGSGSLFIFHGRINPFVIDGAEGATLKNFSIDWKRSFHDELPVVESNQVDKSFVVEIDPELYPHTIQHGQLLSMKYDWQERMGSNIVFDPKTRAPIYNTRDYGVNFYRPYKATNVGKNQVKIEAAVKQPPPVGSVLVSYGTHPTSRLCPAIHLANSRNVHIQDVTIYAAGGMGVIAERSENVDLNRVTVTSSGDRLVSTRADATHFIGCKGTIRIENCLFEHMLDDATNVHGAYVKVVELLDDTKLLCEISHFQQWGLVFGDVGDKVVLLSRETILPLFETTIEKVEVLNEKRLIVTLADLPEEMPAVPLSLENLTWYPDFVMRKCIVRENRARSVLVTTKGKVMIEENHFSSQMNGILIEGDNKFWYESGAVEDVTIQNNEFVNSGFGGGNAYPLFASPMLTPEQKMGAGQYHRNIAFVNNKLKSFDGRMIFARSISGLTVSGNKMEFSQDYPESSDYATIDLRYCDRVTIKNNSAKGFDRDLSVDVSADTTGLVTGSNVGFRESSIINVGTLHRR